MTKRDPYRVLGVARDESAGEIRAAYRRLASALHPDHAGESSSQAFREVREAYELLSDPARRRRFDERVGRKRRARSPDRDCPDPIRSVEPLIPEPEPLGHRTGAAYSLFDEMMNGFLSGYGSGRARFPPSREPGEISVTITPEQAARGGTLSLELPVREACGACAGSGVDWPFACSRCGQRGWLARNLRLDVGLPASVRSGEMFHVSPRWAGGGGLMIRVWVDEDRRGPP